MKDVGDVSCLLALGKAVEGSVEVLGMVLGNKVSPEDWRHARARTDLLEFDWARREEVREARPLPPALQMAWHGMAVADLTACIPCL